MNKNENQTIETKDNSSEENSLFAVFKDYRLHLAVLGIVIVSELIGKRVLQITDTVSLVFLPLVWAVILGLIVYLIKPFKFVEEKQSFHASKIMLLCFSPFLAKMAISSGQAIDKILTAGPALLLQEFGNLATVLIALPLALIIGFKRETIGLTHSIGREQNVGLIVDTYGFNSAETRGVMIMYIVGTIIGAVFLGALASILSAITPIDPLAYAMATGVGSGSMTAAAVGSLITQYPELEADIMAFSGMSNLLTQCTGIYMSIFIGLPLANKLYQWLEPVLGKITKFGRNNAKANQMETEKEAEK